MKLLVVCLYVIFSMNVFAGECKVQTAIGGHNIFGGTSLGASEIRKFIVDYKSCLSILEEAFKANEHRIGQGQVTTVKAFADYYPSLGGGLLANKSIDIFLLNVKEKKECSVTYIFEDSKTANAKKIILNGAEGDNCIAQGILKIEELSKTKPLDFVQISSWTKSKSGKNILFGISLFPDGNDEVLQQGLQEIK